MRLYISPGNTKLGSIPSISLPPLITCPIDAPCRKKGLCYANKLCKIRPSLLATLKDNLEYYNARPDEYFSKITNFLSYANTRFFRWNVHGDLPDQEYFKRIKVTAKKTPNIKHLLFTKRFEFPKSLFSKLPENLSAVFSMWNDYGDERRKLPKAWFYDPKNPDSRIPATALDCPGNCESCAMCWHLKNINHDIILHKH